jgi:hypothetical protein
MLRRETRPGAGRLRLLGAPAEIDTWIEPYRRYWAGRLDALEAHLDSAEEG